MSTGSEQYEYFNSVRTSTAARKRRDEALKNIDFSDVPF